jgi:peptidoglycan/LPS O-acetylase OafA/YrhL
MDAAGPSNPNRVEAAGARYRADIDGLRAMAVLAVVLCHFGIPPFSGGFVGVDVFFVISGLLITALIHEEMARGRFSLASFYERRIRRIFPALIVVLLFTVAVSVVLLVPSDLVRYGESLKATVVFASNFQFWSEAGYFDVAAEQKPLLHTWSLAVEEQFYLIFPPLLYLAQRAGRRWPLAIIGAILALSFIESIWGVWASPSSTFYLLPARMWELMIGAVLAIGAWQAPANPIIRNVCTAVGVALIAAAIFAYDAQTPFPGPTALLPCLGTALVIYGGASGRTIIGDVLSSRGFVFIGLISYSLYLWHWPVLVFARYYDIAPLSLGARVGLALLSAVPAVLSWRYVELPFRGKASFIGRKTLVRGAVAAMVGLALIGAAPRWTHGFPQRYPDDIRRILAVGSNPDEACSYLTVEQIRRDGLCKIGAKGSTSPSFLLWGDSHADAVERAIDEVAARRGIAGLYATSSGCAPLIGVKVFVGWQSGRDFCVAVNDEIARIAADKTITQVILVARWAKNAEGTEFGEPTEAPKLLTDDETPDAALANDRAVFARGLRRTIALLVQEGKEVVIVASIPEIGPSVPEAIVKRRLLGKTVDIRPSLAEYLTRQDYVFQVLDALRGEFPITIVYPHQILCASSRCEIEIDGRPLYRDGHHLTDFGAEQLEPMFDQVMRGAAAR